MMISRIAPATRLNAQTRSPDAPFPEAHPDDDVTGGALVPLERPTRVSLLRASRPEAPFVAHLIAMAEQAPQTRTLRRATSADAQATYERIGTRGNDNGKLLSQTA